MGKVSERRCRRRMCCRRRWPRAAGWAAADFTLPTCLTGSDITLVQVHPRHTLKVNSASGASSESFWPGCSSTAPNSFELFNYVGRCATHIRFCLLTDFRFHLTNLSHRIWHNSGPSPFQTHFEGKFRTATGKWSR